MGFCETRPGGEAGEPGLGSGSESKAKPARHTRKLSDKLLLCFHHACDIGDFEVAHQLLPILETMTMRRVGADDGSRRRGIEGLVAAHERLWHLRNPTVA